VPSNNTPLTARGGWLEKGQEDLVFEVCDCPLLNHGNWIVIDILYSGYYGLSTRCNSKFVAFRPGRLN
jgi:hypothetical protein